jgi:C-terminal processing protease CtpA/Prc
MRLIVLIVIILALLLPAVVGGASQPRFGGIGIDGVPRADGQIEVRQLVAGGPAHLADVRVGDIITRIDGKATKGSDFQEMVNRRLRGRAGTRVRLVLSRPGNPKPFRLTLTRRELVTPAR